MTDAGWGAGPGVVDPDKRIKTYESKVRALGTKFDKLFGELAQLVSSNPIGEMQKCKDIGLHAKLQLSLKQLHEQLDHGKSPAYNAYEAVRKQVIPPMMEDQNISTITIKGVGRVDLREDIFATTEKGAMVKLPPLGEDGKPDIGPLGEDGEPTKENWELADLHHWLALNGAADLVTETVNASSLKALLRMKLKDGVEIPPELIRVVPYSFAAITKR